MTWQQLLILVVLAVAVAYLVLRFIRRKRPQDDCSDCPAARLLQDRRKGTTR